MNVQELNYILCIARHQNLTEAAQELYLSQPTLSKYLQKPEREMNGKLFSRVGNRYVPTDPGRRYLEYARRMLELDRDWQKELQDLNACRQGELNIAFPLMRSSCLVPRVLPVFHARYPGIQVNLWEESCAIQEKLLLDDRLDFAVFNEGHPPPPPDLRGPAAGGSAAGAAPRPPSGPAGRGAPRLPLPLDGPAAAGPGPLCAALPRTDHRAHRPGIRLTDDQRHAPGAKEPRGR